MALLNRKALLEKEPLKVEKVDLGSGDFVFVRQMTGRERDRWEQSLFRQVVDKKGNISMEQTLEDFRAKLAVHTLCDETGKNIMEPGDYETLSQNISAFRLAKIVQKAQELNKISPQDKEYLVKNSGTGTTEGSHSGSVKN